MDILRHRLQNLHEFYVKKIIFEADPQGNAFIFCLLLQALWRKRLHKSRSLVKLFEIHGSVPCMLLSSFPAPTPRVLSRVLSHTEGALLCMSPLLHASLFHKFC